MKKADMETHRAEYQGLMAMARATEAEGLYRAAIDLALASWEHIDGMMQFGRRYEEKEFVSIKGIEMILKYAPLLLDFHSLDKLEALLKGCRRIERNTSDCLVDRLSEARALMSDAHRLWDHLERQPGVRQDTLRQSLGGNQDQWRSMAEAWEKMGLLRRQPQGRSYKLAISTRMAEVVPAKCPSCGFIANAPKAMFLEPLPCSQCGTKGVFVILAG